jgi:hypothetical protein
MFKDIKLSRGYTAILGLGLLAFTLSLGSFMVSGWFSRYLADDYCKAAHFILYGFWNGQVVAWRILAGRFMVTFLTAVFNLAGTFFYRLTPALVICLWVVELSVLLLRLQRWLPLKLPAVHAWLCGMLVTLAVILGTPSRLQSLYWRDGMFNYNFPILFFLLLLIIAVPQFEINRGGWRLWLALGGCTLLAFFAAGCSESFAAYETGFFILAAGVAILFGRGWRRRRMLQILAGALAGTLAGLALIWLSPDTAARQKLLPASPSLLKLVLDSMRYAYYFMRTSTNLMKWVTLMSAGIPAVLVFYASPRAIGLKWWQWLYILAAILLIGYALLVPVFAPSVYAESSDPESRVLIITRFSLVCTFIALGVGVGLSARQVVDDHLVQLREVFNRSTLVILTGLCLYALVICWQVNSVEIPARQAWAVQWDQRDALLRAAAAGGQASVHVVELQSMGKLMEYGPDANDTLNICVAQYYGLRSVVATPP